MHAYTELIKPTVVTQLELLSGPDAGLKYLFVVKGGSLLQVYEVSDSYKWLCELTLQGQVCEISALNSTELLLTFLPAKMVIVKFNTKKMCLETLSMHFYERVKNNNYGQIIPKHSIDPLHSNILFRFQTDVTASVQPKVADPLLFTSTEQSLESEVFNILDLAYDLKVGSIIDFQYLHSFSEPTLAVICEGVVNWAGFSSQRGNNTNALVLLAQKSATKFTSFANLKNLSRYFLKIKSLKSNDANIIGVLIGDSCLGLLTTDLVVVELKLDYSFANCQIEQLENSHFIFVALENGQSLVVDLKRRDCTEMGTRFPGTTSITSCGETLVVGTKWGIQLYDFKITKNDRTNVAEIGDINSLKDLYSISQSNHSHDSASVNLKFSISTCGPFSSIARIDNGLVCTNNNGLLLVDNKLNLDIYDKFRPRLDLIPGLFWLLDHKERHILITGNQNFSDITQSEGDPVETPRPLDGDTLVAVVSDQSFIYFVQTRRVVKVNFDYDEVGKYDFPSKQKAITAELRDGKLLVRFEKGSVLLDCSNLKPHKLRSPITSICSDLIASVDPIRGILHITASDYEKSFFVGNLDSFITEEHEAHGELPEFISVYLMKFGTKIYVGLHCDRIFSVYEYTGDLVKRFTIPFAVNHSPIHIPNAEVLIFMGKKTHVLVKSDETAFECHQLNIPGIIVDALQYNESKFVLLDDTNKLYYCMFDPNIDYFSNSLPFRQIELPEPIEPTVVVFNEETGNIIVGGNIKKVKEVTVMDPLEELEIKQEQERLEEQVEENLFDPENQDEIIEEEEAQTGEEINMEHDIQEDGTEEGHEGRIYTFSLYNYKFQKDVLRLDETLLSMQVLYPDPSIRFEKTPKQVLAIGTSKDDIETKQTNGHIRLYGIQEEDDGDYVCLSYSEYAHELLRGPVSAIYELMDYVVVAHGQQIKVFNYVQGLVPVGFFFTHPFMQDIKCIRNVIALGERLHPPRLVNFALQPRRMDLLSSADTLLKGNGLSPTTAVEFVSSSEREDMGVLYSTADGRLQLYMFDPELPDSLGGSRLVPHKAFYTGHRCVSMCQSDVSNSNDIVAFGATSVGSIFSVRPLNESQFRTLYLLIQQMFDKEPNPANLNARMHRSCFESHTAAGASNVSTNTETPAWQMIDINFIQRFWGLPLDRQSAYTRSLGYEGLRKAQVALNSEGRDKTKLN